MPCPRESWSRLGVLEPLTVRADDHAFETFVARPLEAAPAPTVILLPGEVRAEAQSLQLAEQFAFDGFMALAPDLTHHLPPVRPLRGSGFDLYRMGWGVEAAFDDLKRLAEVARGVRGGSGLVGAVGWGAGGLLAYSLVARGVVDAAVVYAEPELESLLDGSDGVAQPLLLHLTADAIELERWYDDHQWVEVERSLERLATAPLCWRREGLADVMTRRFLRRRLGART